MRRLLGRLIAGTFALWALLFLPARIFAGQEATVYSLVAAVLCLVPTGLTLAWASREGDASPYRRVVLVLGGTGLRMAFVLGVGLGVYLAFPYFRQSSFWVCLLIFYLFTLCLEMVLLQGGQAVQD